MVSVFYVISITLTIGMRTVSRCFTTSTLFSIFTLSALEFLSFIQKKESVKLEDIYQPL